MDVITIKNLVKRYGSLTAVDGLSLSVKEGEIYGLLGPNGSGKSTTISCLLQLLPFDKGEITVFGKRMTPGAEDIKRNIGIVFQDVAVFEELNVYDNVEFFCGLYIKDKKERKKLTAEAIEFTGLTEFKKFYPKKLSGGLKRRLNIACGIAHKPKLIILDEPTVAVDPQSRNKILSGIQELAAEGATVLYTSHYMEEVEQICTKMAIIDKGRLLAEGTADELKAMIGTGEKIVLELSENSDGAETALKNMDFVKETSAAGSRLTLKTEKEPHALLKILEALKKIGVSPLSAISEKPTLNDVFLEITGRELRDNV